MNHQHAHTANSSHRGRLGLALGIAVAIFVAEVVGSLVTGSLALLVDAGHVLADSVGLVAALVAAILMARPATSRRTWGWQRAEVLAAGGQSAILLGIGGYALYEGVMRLIHAPEVQASGMLGIGILGLLGNIVAILILASARGENLNMKAAFLEVVADALGSVAVIVSAGVIALTGWTRADAVAGIVVACMIIPRAMILLRESGSILLETVPPGLNLDDVREHMIAIDHVRDVHDLHASRVASGMPTLTCHIVLADECFADGHSLDILAALQQCVQTHHGVSVEHATFQLESAGVATQHRAHMHA